VHGKRSVKIQTSKKTSKTHAPNKQTSKKKTVKHMHHSTMVLYAQTQLLESSAQTINKYAQIDGLIKMYKFW